MFDSVDEGDNFHRLDDGGQIGAESLDTVTTPDGLGADVERIPYLFGVAGHIGCWKAVVAPPSTSRSMAVR